MHTLSELLAVLRKRRGLSQYELATRAGLSERQVSRYETGGSGVMSARSFAGLLAALPETDEERAAMLAALAALAAR
jgi:transcriptional regulator with XRE-family HTH domain